MQVSNTRRICRCYMIDADSILPTTPEMIESIRKLPYMDEWITKKQAQAAAGKDADVDNPEGLADGTLDTNLGMFGAYFKMWLDNNKYISHDSDCFVSTLPQTSAGIPFQVYCFTSTSKWFPYEGIQDLVFEHLAAMLASFRLYAFENPSGRDTIIDGYLSPGKDINGVFGIPYPFFRDPSAPDSRTSPNPATKNEGAPKLNRFRHTLHNAGLLPFSISLPYRQSCLGGGYTRLPGHCCSLREHLAGYNTLQGHRRLWLLHFLHRYN